MLKSAAFIFICAAAALYAFNNKLIFPQWTTSRTDSPDIFKLASTDGRKISALYLAEPNATFTILYSHGNGEDIPQIRCWLELYRRHGYSILSYDYQGYGTSEGKPTEQNAYDDAEAAYKYLTTDLKIPPQKIIILGRSVGSGPSCYLAEKYPVAGVILESAFTSAFCVITQASILPFDKFPNIVRLKNIKCPVMVIHGRMDLMINYLHGKKLYRTANNPKMCYFVPAAGHNNILDTAGEEYFVKLSQFVRLIQNQTP